MKLPERRYNLAAIFQIETPKEPPTYARVEVEYSFYKTPGKPTTPKSSEVSVSDPVIERLEDRIKSSEERSQLRLEAAMAKTDAKLDILIAGIAEVKAQGRDTRTLILGSVFVVLFGVLGILIGLKQVWLGGVQVGQALQTSAASSPATRAQ